jgi:hypothetical protein
MVGLLEAGVRHDQPATIQHQVRDQISAEDLDLLAELLRLAAELLQGLGQAVGDLHIAPGQGPDQLVLMVARHRQGVARGDHAHHQPQHPRRVRAAIHQVTDEHRPPAVGVRRVDRPPVRIAFNGVPELAQQDLQFGPAAVHVADDVERTRLVPVVVEQPLPHDLGGVDLLDPAQHMYLAEPLPGQPSQRAA